MAAREESEMLELCESEIDDLKPLDVQKPPDSPRSVSTINDPGDSQDKDNEIQKLYTSMGINLKDSDNVSQIRLDTIHINGLNEMSTKDVYRFFSSMKPMTLEWINDSACNVVWPDKNSAARALLEFTHPEETEAMDVDVKKSSTNIPEGKEDNQIVVVEEDDDDDVVQEGSEDGELPEPKEVKTVVWRTANNESDKQLKFRFATLDDKKVRGAEKYSEYYRKHGNPNFGGLKGLISGSMKRKMRQGAPTEHFDDLEEDDFLEDDNQKVSSLSTGIKGLTSGSMKRKMRQGTPTEPFDDPEDDDYLEDNRQKVTSLSTGKTEQREPSRKRPKMKMYADEEERRSQKLKSNRISNRLGNVTVNVSLEEEKEEGYDELEVSSPQEFGSKSVWDRLQVEVPNTQYSYRTDKKRSHRTRDQDTQRDLRKKLQIIRNSKKDHTSPLLLTASTKRAD